MSFSKHGTTLLSNCIRARFERSSIRSSFRSPSSDILFTLEECAFLLYSSAVSSSLRQNIDLMTITGLPVEPQFFHNPKKPSSKIRCHRLFLHVIECSNNSLFSLADITEATYDWTRLALHSSTVFPYVCIFALKWQIQIIHTSEYMPLKYAKTWLKYLRFQLFKKITVIFFQESR